MESYPTFHNEVGLPIVRIGCREFKCIGDKPPQDHPHIYLNMGDASEISCPYFLRYSVSIRAWAHTKLIRQIVLTVTGTELKSSNAASFVMPAAANQRQAPSSRSGRFTMATNDPKSAGCKRRDGRTSDSGCARPSHRSHRGSPVG